MRATSVLRNSGGGKEGFPLKKASWSVKTLLPSSPSSFVASKKDIENCAFLCKLSVVNSEKIIKDVERVIECARKIGEVDTSPSQFKLSKEEIERGVIFGMTSPVRHSLQPRPISSPDPSPYAPKWNRESMRENSKKEGRMEGGYFVVPVTDHSAE